MSREIDEKVVELVLDNYQFESKASQSMKTADSLNESLQMKGVDKGFDNINSAIKNSNMSGFGEAVQQVGLKFSGLWTVADQAFRNITNTAMNTGKRVISALTIDPVKMGFSEYETKINAIQTIMSNTASKGTTMSDVTKVINELNTYADKTIYNFAEMTKNIGTFTAAGVGLEDSAAAIQGIANLAAASGSNSQQASTAMYQLSQALSTGTVRLMDWNSVVNAGMGGEKFQNALKETARECGVSVDKIVEKAGSFRESLSDGWLTADILNTTLKKFTVEGAAEYAKSMQDSGKYTQDQVDALKKEAQAMEDAATKVKTFTQLFSTLEESLQSGWSQTWEIVIGDFEEAKEQLSDFAAKVGGVIDKMGEFRNEVLGSGLSGGWKQLMGKGIADGDALASAIKTVASDKNIKNLDKLKEKWAEEGGFQESLKDGWLTSDVLADSITKYTKDLEGLSTEELKAAGYTKDQVNQMIELNNAIRDGSISVDEFITKINRPSGAENLFASLNNLFDALMSAIEPIKEAFSEIFFEGKNLGEIIYSITAKIREFTESLIIAKNSATFDKLKRTFKGLFAVVDILWQLAKAFVSNIIGPLLGGVDDLGGGILGVTATFGDWLVALRDAIKESDIFNKVFKKIVDVVKQVWEVFKKIIGEPVMEVFGAIFDRLGVGISFVGDEATSLKDKFLNAFNKITEFMQSSGLMEFFKKLYDFIKELADDVGAKLADLIRNIDFDKIKEFLKVLMAGGITAGIFRIVKAIFDFFNGFESFGSQFKDGVIGILEGIQSAFESFEKKANAKLIRSIAVSVTLLALSIFLLSTIDTDKLWMAVSAITIMIGQLVGGMELLSRLEIKKDKLSGLSAVRKMLTSMVAMATALIILAGACAILAKLDWNGLAKGLVGIVVMMGAMAGMVILLSKFAEGDKIKKMAFSMILLATSMVILAAACKIFSTMSWEGMGVALISVVVLLGAVIGYCVAMSKLVKGGMKRAVGSLFIIATSLVIMAAACKIFSTMPLESMGAGLAAIASILGLVLGYTITLSKVVKEGKIVSAAASLLIIAVALVGIAGACALFSLISWESMGKAAAAISAVAFIVILLGGLTDALDSTSDILIGVAALLLVVGAIAGLGAAMQLFANVDWNSVLVALTMITIAVGTLAGISGLVTAFGGYIAAGAAVLLATGVIFGMFAADLLLIAVALQEFEKVSWENIGKAAVALGAVLVLFSLLGASSAFMLVFSTAALMLAGAIYIFAAAISVLGKAMPIFAQGFLTFIDALGAGLVLFAGYIGAIIAAFFDGLSVAIGSIGGFIIKALDVICDVIFKIIEAIIRVCVESVPVVAEGLLTCIVEILRVIAEHITEVIDVLADIIFKIIDGLAVHAPAFIEKLANLLKIIFDGVRDVIVNMSKDDIAAILIVVGSITAVLAYLNFVIAPLLPGATAAVLGLAVFFAELALVLAAFGGIAQIPGVMWIIEEGGKFLGAIGTALGQFVGGIFGGIAQGFTSSLPQIGSDLSAFMTNLTPFLEGLKLVDPASMEAIKTLADVILTLTGASILEGLTSWFTGGVSLAQFGQELAAFGPYFKQYADSIAGLDPAIVIASANAALSLAEMASKLPNAGGVVSWFTGENRLSVFGEELVKFGPYFKRYADSVAGINPEVVTASANAALSLAEMASKLPNAGGMVSWFTGDNTLGVFADELAKFGPSFKRYADTVAGIDPAVVTASSNAALSLAEMASKLPNAGGMVSWFTGDNTLSAFADELAKFGPSFKRYADIVSGIDPAVVTASANAALALSELTNNLPESGGWKQLWSGEKDLAAFGDSLVDFGKGIKRFGDEVVGINASATIAASQSLSHIIAVLKDASKLNPTALSNFGTALGGFGKVGVDAFIEAFDGAADRVTEAGGNMVSNLIEGAEKKSEYMIVAFTAPIESALKAIRGIYQNFYDAGAYLVTGFANGISANDFQAAAKARAMAKAAAQAAEKALDINSPSKVFYGIGAFAGEGFVNALGDYSSDSYDAGSVMADSARKGLSSAINSIKNMIDNGIDAQPTIRPVMDLSDVQSGANAISGMLNMGSSIGVSANVGAISTMMRSYSQNGGNSEVISAINKLRDSLSNTGNTTYTINGITYDDGSNIAEAVQSIVRAARVERRV